MTDNRKATRQQNEMSNNDLRNIIEKTNDRASRTAVKPRVKSGTELREDCLLLYTQHPSCYTCFKAKDK